MNDSKYSLEKLTAFCKRRGFVFPSSEIYGGMQGIYDYGHGNVGKRYRRQDEIGTPYCITVDFQSLDDDTVTVRDRDSMAQERVHINELRGYLYNHLEGGE